MDVGGWLRRLGLEQYEATFRENKIDDTVLLSLTAENLKDLGVGFVGDRRKLLDAMLDDDRLNAAVSRVGFGPTVALDARPLLSALRIEVRHRTMSEKCHIRTSSSCRPKKIRLIGRPTVATPRGRKSHLERL